MLRQNNAGCGEQLKLSKFLSILILSFTLVFTLVPSKALATESDISIDARAVIGDDYPKEWKNAANDSMIDTWGMYNRQCTSFAAWRLHSANKFNFDRAGLSWMAYEWGVNARSLGYKVDKKPAVGAIAWWKSSGSNYSGHVAWVAEVKGNTVVIEEYNFDGNGKYHKRSISKSDVSGYIHFKDITQKTTKPEEPENPPVTEDQPTTEDKPAAKRVTITFNYSYKGGPKTLKITGVKGKTLAGKMVKSPKRKGYAFKGWKSMRNGSEIGFTKNTKLTKSITVYAKWKKLK